MEFVEELEKKREELNGKAEEHRINRDRHNDETRRIVEQRDIHNQQVKQFFERANGLREKRNTLNEEVKKAKVTRDELNRKAAELAEVVNRLKREKLPQDGATLGRMKRELRALEFKHQTTVLTPDKEKELLRIITSLQAQIRDKESILDQDTEIRDAIRAATASRDAAEESHRNVSKLAEEAQLVHEEMMKCFSEGDRARAEADKFQEMFLQMKSVADEEHRTHIALIRQVHDFDKLYTGMRRREREATRAKSGAAAKRAVDEIFEKFKRGEKLSTEDLMLLQTKGI